MIRNIFVTCLILAFKFACCYGQTIVLDSSFGQNGVFNYYSFDYSYGYATQVQADGKIVVGCEQPSVFGTPGYPSVVRLSANGSIDSSFGDAGACTITLGGYILNTTALAIQSDGKILAAGFLINRNGVNKAALVRLKISGNLDSTFGINGIDTLTDVFDTVAKPFYTSQWFALVIQPDEKIILCGSDILGNALLARYNSNGSPDTTFAVKGIGVLPEIAGYNFRGFSLALQSNGKIVIGGEMDDGNDNYMGAFRYKSNGLIDSSFKTYFSLGFRSSLEESTCTGIAIQSSGSIILGGYADNPSSGNGAYNEFASMRVDSTGEQDLKYGTSSIKIAQVDDLGNGGGSGANAMAIEQNGNKLLAGRAGDNNNATFLKFALAEYTPNGALLQTVTVPGNTYQHLNGYSLALQTDGKILVSGTGITARYGRSVLTGVKEMNAYNISIFPNPASNFIYFQNNHALPGTIELVNILGQVQYLTHFTPNQSLQINVGSFTKGIYTVEVNEGGINYRQKLILQ